MAKKTKIIFLILIIFFIGASFSAGYYAGEIKKECPVCASSDIDFSLFWETWKILQDKFVNPDRLNVQNMIYGAISGMVKSLKDPYTVFLNPKQSKEFLEDVIGRFEGVGMEIGIRKGQLQVIAPLEGTPAQKAGIKAGDKILKINDTFTTDITIEEAVNLIRGPEGTEVSLTILRKGWDSPKEIKITRAVIEVPSLEWKLMDLPDGGKKKIAYIKLYQFSEKADYDFTKAAVEILNSPAEMIVLDLRNNPGGYLEVAQDIGGWFLKKGEIVAIEDFGVKGKREVYKAEGNSKLSGYPIVVLINQGSASGSEILAGALRDDRGVKLIGETSFGKGSVQELERLKDGSSLKVTVAKWLTPKGQSISDVGLVPDIEVKISKEEEEAGKDPQLDKAIEVLKKIR